MTFEQKLEIFMNLFSNNDLRFLNYCYSRLFELYFWLEYCQSEDQIINYYIKFANEYFLELKKYNEIPLKEILFHLENDIRYFRSFFVTKDYNFLIYCYDLYCGKNIKDQTIIIFDLKTLYKRYIFSL